MPAYHLKKTALAIAITSSLALTACSGGSSGGSSPSKEPPQTQQTVSGNAVKGVLKNAVVTAFELEENGARMVPAVGSTRTNDAGEYNLELGQTYSGGIVEIVVTADTDTRMVCDASKCGDIPTGGEISSLPPTFELTRLSTPRSGEATISAPVSAWTTLSAKRAKTLAGRGEGISLALTKANRVVSELVGYNIEITPARGLSQLDANSNPEEFQSAVFNAVVADFIFSDGGDIAVALKTFSEILENDKIDDSDDFNIAKLNQLLPSAIARAPTGNAEAQDRIAQKLEELLIAGDFNADEIEKAVRDPAEPLADKIAAFKDFVASIRDFGAELDNLAANGSLESAIGADEEALVAIFDDNTVNTLLLSVEVLGQALNAVIDDPAVTDFDLTDPDNPAAVIGNANVTVAENEDQTSFSLSVTGNAVGGSDFLPFDLTLSAPVPFALLSEDNAVLSELTESSELILSGSIGTENTTRLSLNELAVNLSLEETITSAEGEGLSSEAVFAVAVSGDVRGQIEIDALRNSSPYRFTGELFARLVKLNDDALILDKLLEPVSLETLRLSGEFSGDAIQTFSASASLNIRNARQFDVFGWLDLDGNTLPLSGTFDELPDAIKGPFDQAANGQNYFGTVNFDQNHIQDGQIFIQQQPPSETVILDGNALTAALAIVDDAISAQYNTDNFNYEIFHSSLEFSSDETGTVYTRAQFSDLETANHFINTSVTLSTSIKFGEFDGKAIATLRRNTLLGGALTMRLLSDGSDQSDLSQDLRLEIKTANADGPGVASIVFSNPAGFRLTAAVAFDDDSQVTGLTGDAFVGEEDIGDLELRNGVPFLVYAENNGEVSFESLF